MIVHIKKLHLKTTLKSVTPINKEESNTTNKLEYGFVQTFSNTTCLRKSG